MSQDAATRLNKYLADAGLASRRGADTLIFAGRVRVNGAVIREPGYRVQPGDRVDCDSRPVSNEQIAPRYLMMNKPVHTVSTVSDPQGRRTVLDLLPRDLRALRVVPVGRLDYMSEGLLLLTNDGETTLRLTHPSFEHRKVYEVTIREEVTEAMCAAMRQGMVLAEGEHLAPVEVTATRQPDGRTRLHLTLRQGINRQIRRMCRDLGLTILRLRRVAVGPLNLGTLASGKWRHLNDEEILKLKTALGLVTQERKGA